MSAALPSLVPTMRRVALTLVAAPLGAFMLAVGMAWAALPASEEGFRGVLRLATWLGGLCALVYPILGARLLYLAHRVRALTAADRTERLRATARVALVRDAYLLPSRSTVWACSVLAIGSLLDVFEILPISRLDWPARVAANLACVGAFQASAHVVTLRFRAHLWAWLRLLTPRDVAMRRPQRLALRLGARVFSALLIPASGTSARTWHALGVRGYAASGHLPTAPSG